MLLLRTGSNPADIDRFGGHTGKYILSIILPYNDIRLQNVQHAGTKPQFSQSKYQERYLNNN